MSFLADDDNVWGNDGPAGSSSRIITATTSTTANSAAANVTASTMSAADRMLKAAAVLDTEGPSAALATVSVSTAPSANDHGMGDPFFLSTPVLPTASALRVDSIIPTLPNTHVVQPPSPVSTKLHHSGVFPASLNQSSHGHGDKGDIAAAAEVAAAVAVLQQRSLNPPLSDGELPGAESAKTAHGRYIGPNNKLKFHQYTIYSKLLCVGACAWIVVGMVLICTVFLAITINVAYAAFHASETLNVWMLLIGLAFYVELGWIYVSSLLRTSLRLMMFLWGANFGNDPNADIFPVFLVEPYVSSIIHRLHGHVTKTPSRDDVENETDPLLDSTHQGNEGALTSQTEDSHEVEKKEKIADRIDLVNHYIYLLLLAIFIGAPISYLSISFGFWSFVSFVSIGVCVSSVSTIFLINSGARFVRTFKILEELWSDPGDVTDAELRATYYATCGFDNGYDLLSVTVSRGMKGAVTVFIAGLIFTGFSSNFGVLVVTGIVIIALWILGRHQIRIWFSSFESKTFFEPHINQHGEPYALYNGAEEFPCFVVFGVRCAIFFSGFISLLYYDIKWRVVGGDDILRTWGEVGVHRILIFLFLVILHDVALLLPLIRVRTPDHHWLQVLISQARPRVAIIMSLMGLIVATAVWSRILYPGFSSSVACLLSCLLISYRHPRCRWTNYQATFVKHHGSCEARLERRATRNAKSTLFAFFGIFGGAWVLALALGASQRVVVPRIPEIPPTGLPSSFIKRQELHGLASLYSITGKNGSEIRNDETGPNLQILPAVCTLRITHSSPLNLIDIAVMARGSYEVTRDAAEAKLRSYERPNLLMWSVYNTSVDNDELGGVRFVEYRNGNESSSKLSIVAVRGTSNLNDVFQDLYLWATSALLQLSSFIGTMVSLWPPEAVDRFAELIMTFGPVDSTLVYWSKVEAHVDYLRSQGRSVVMTGHSLGGAVSAIVAGHKEIPSLAFSAPGLGYSTRRYNLRLEVLQKHAVNVVPWHDLVPAFDLQVGLVQSIPCIEDEFLTCHSLDLTIETARQLCEGSGTLI